MPGRSLTNEGYRFGFQGQEKDDELKGQGNSLNFKFRVHDSRLGRFLSIDPLSVNYPWNSPYAFSENDVIRCIDLEGLEKLALAGTGNGNNYHQGDANSFYVRALNMEKYGYRTSVVSTGVDIIKQLETETKSAKEITRLIHFSHGTNDGIMINWDEGLYSSGFSEGGKNEKTIADIKSKVESGSVKFSSYAVWIMISCNAFYNEGRLTSDFAYNATKELGITTIASNGVVEPEIINGKETGRITTNGSFFKVDQVFDLKYTIDGKTETHTFTTKREAEAYNRGFNNDNKYSYEISERIEVTDLGDTIDPAEF